MKRITLVIPSLTNGGAERVMTTLANAWAAGSRNVTLLTFDDGHGPPFYSLDPRVNHRPLGVAKASTGAVSALRNNLGRFFALRRAIIESTPDVILSFLDTTNVLTLIATRGLSVPVVVEEHTDPAQKQLGAGWVRLRRLIYPRADRVVVLSETSLAYFDPSIRQRASIIPNPIVVEPPASVATSERSRRVLIAMGRFGPEKGFDLLLEAFGRIAGDHTEWDLVIWGDGDLRSELEIKRDRLGLTDRISMPGRTKTPHDKLRQADLFVMSSRREGFPMALGEAMACGLAAVSSDCPSGPRELIRNGVDGLLVPPEDANALASALMVLMSDEPRRRLMAQRAPDVLTRFGLERIMQQWDDLFSEVIAARKSRPFRPIRTFGSEHPRIRDRRDDYDV